MRGVESHQKIRPEHVARIESALGARVLEAVACRGGYTPAERWRLRLEGGQSAFAKLATNEATADWLRAEQLVYGQLEAPFLAGLRAWDDDGALPILLLEDLGHGHWPPPWTPAQVDRVQTMLGEVAATPPPAGVPSLCAGETEFDGWSRVAAAPAEFLALGLASKAWLERALEPLVAAEAALELDGDALLHQDVRSDNLCLLEDRVVLVDWNFACRGPAELDVAFWLPSLHSEGGPLPDELAPKDPSHAAVVSGFFAWRAGQDKFPGGGERVRGVQLSQLQCALPWAARALGLPAPDGARA